MQVQPPRRWRGLVAAMALGACGELPSPPTCQDLLPAGEATFAKLFELVSSQTDARGCARCHDNRVPIYGFNFAERAPAYDALAHQAARVYPQVESGRMPKNLGGEGAWQADELRLYRSWYCEGAFADP